MVRAASPGTLAFLGVVWLAAPPIVMHPTSYSCRVDRSEVTSVDRAYFGEGTKILTRRVTRTSDPSLFIAWNVTTLLESGLWITTKLYEMHNNQYKQSFINSRDAFCSLMNSTSFALEPLREILKAIGIGPCPIKPGLYRVDNWLPSYKSLPPFLPGPDDWRLDLTLFEDEKPLVGMRVYVHILRRKG